MSGLKIGHTGITWGTPGDVERAYRDVAELGYLGFETFGSFILEWNQRPGGYSQLITRYGIPTVAAYCSRQWIGSDTAAGDISLACRQADALKEIGGECLVVACARRSGPAYTTDELRRLADALNTVGEYVRSIGLRLGFHPHTGTPVETRSEIDALLALVDPTLVGFAPDTGQIAKGGSDVLEVLAAYGPRVTHVHLKDWGGTRDVDARSGEVDATGYVNYVPAGTGVLPIRAIVDRLVAIGYTAWLNVELDGTDRAPRPPREAAEMSRRALETVLGGLVEWRR